MKRAMKLAGVLVAGSVIAAFGCDAGGELESRELAMAGLPVVTGSDLVGDTTVVVRRVYAGPAVGWGSTVSPDGRYVTVRQEAGNLGRIDLVSGEVQPLIHKGTWSEAGEWVETNVYSPDGSRIAFVYGGPGGYEIRVADADGSNPRTLVSADDLPGGAGLYGDLSTWSGDEIFGLLWGTTGDGPAIVAISASDGSVRVVKSIGIGWREELAMVPVTVSPDGELLTYGGRSSNGDVDVRIIRSADGSDVSAMEGPANDVAVVWTHDGSALLVQSDRGMTEGIWRQRVDDGRIVGEPELIRGDLWQFEHVGASRDAYYFGVRTDFPRVRTAAFDPETGAFLSEPTPVDPLQAGPSALPVWSPDGQALAYVRQSEEKMTGLEESTLVIRSILGPDAREIPAPGKALRRLLAWTPDDRIISLGKSGEDGDWYLWSIDLESGAVTTLARPELPRIEAVSADGATWYVVGGCGSATPPPSCRRDVDGWDLFAVDAATGSERLLTGGHAGPERVYLSPDGETVAVLRLEPESRSTSISILPTSGGELREVFRRAPPDGVSLTTAVFWASDSRSFFFGTHGVERDGVPGKLWKVTLTGSAPTVVELDGAGIHPGHDGDVVIHPDGNRIAFVGGERTGEIWMMTNLSGTQ